MRRRERHVPGDRKLTSRFDCGCPAAEIEQQIVYRELRDEFLTPAEATAKITLL
jgi:hypothetical protein